MAAPEIVARRRAEALQRVLQILELDTTTIPSTKASALEQQMFVAEVLSAIAERLPKPRGKK